MTSVDKPTTRGFLRFMRQMLSISWHCLPVQTALGLGSIVGVAVLGILGPVMLNFLVGALTSGSATRMVVAGMGTAIAFGLAIWLQKVAEIVPQHVAIRVGRLELHESIHRRLAEIPGIAHLENAAVLNRLELVRRSQSKLTLAFWDSTRAICSTFRVVVSLVLIATVAPVLCLLALAVILPVLGDRRAMRSSAEAELAVAEDDRLQQDLFSLLMSPTGAQELAVGGASTRLTTRWAEIWTNAGRLRQRAVWRGAAWSAAGWAAFSGLFAAGLALHIWMQAGAMTVSGSLVMAVTLAWGLQQAVRATATYTARAMVSTASIEAYLWMDTYLAEQQPAAPTAACPAVLRRGIAFQDVSFNYPGSDRPALDQVNVQIEPGSVVAVVGEYGSGKTTFIKLLTKMYAPSTGRILIDNLKLADLDTESWRGQVTATFQDLGRFHTKVWEGIGLGDLNQFDDRDEIEKAAVFADAHGFITELRDGYDSQLGLEVGGTELSGGQWQRIALARAAMRATPLLWVLDEPTASLDAFAEERVFSRTIKRAKMIGATTGCITILVSHRFSTVVNADRILVFHEGRLIEDGDHRGLVARGGRYAESFRLHSSAYS